MKYFTVPFYLLFVMNSFAQQIIPYSYLQSQRINKILYSKETRFHTSIKSDIQSDSIITDIFDSLIYFDQKKNVKWTYRKIFWEHLFKIKKNDYSVYFDLLPDFQIGRDRGNGITTWLNTRGYQFGGTIGEKISFISRGFENQSRFSDYLTRYIDVNGIIPGMVNAKVGSHPTIKDWAYVTALLNFKPNKYFSFTLGHEKNFIGDGYRSMILSDIAPAYPFFKMSTTLGNVQFISLWSQFQDPLSPRFSYDNGFRKKWGVFHYLDWNLNNRLSLGFFDAIIWQDADANGKRGFDASYLIPIIFLRPVEGMNGSPDNALLGFNTRYKLAKNLSIYGQFVMDEFIKDEVFKGKGHWTNKFAYQFGFKGFEVFKIKDLNYLFEFNTARPFTYSQRTSLLNYGHYTEPLAHPLGANFKEFLTIWNFYYNNWQFSTQFNKAYYGYDNGQNVGKDINQSYFTLSALDGFRTGDGLKTIFNYAETKVSYLINPKINLRFEISGVFRQEKNIKKDDKTFILNLGLRSTFRNLYQDF